VAAHRGRLCRARGFSALAHVVVRRDRTSNDRWSRPKSVTARRRARARQTAVKAWRQLTTVLPAQWHCGSVTGAAQTLTRPARTTREWRDLGGCQLTSVRPAGRLTRVHGMPVASL